MATDDFRFTQNEKQRIYAAMNNKPLSDKLIEMWQITEPSAFGVHGGYEYTAGFAGKTTTTTQTIPAIDPADDELIVLDASGFGAGGGRAVIGDSEIITYTGTQTTPDHRILGVARGQFGTNAVGHPSGTTIHNAEFAWESLDGVSYTAQNATDGDWLKFPLDRTVHLASDVPYWSSPTPLNHVDKGIFGGDHMPYGVTKLYDFTTTDWADGTTSSLHFQEVRTGDLLMCRFDFEVIPQIANSTLEVGLTFATRDPETLAVTFEFPLTTTPIFYGTGTVGRTFLNRPFISAYFASDEDRYALALPAIKCDNQILIRPQAMLTSIIR